MSRSNGSPTHAGSWPPQRPQQQRGEGEAGANSYAYPHPDPALPGAHDQAGAYAHQHDPYAPQQGGAGNPGYGDGYRAQPPGPDQGYGSHGYGHGYDPHAPGFAEPQADLRGSVYGDWQAGQASDPRGYDLGNYGGSGAGQQEPAGWRGGAAEPRLDWNGHEAYPGRPAEAPAYGYGRHAGEAQLDPDPRATLIGYQEDDPNAGALEPAYDVDEAGEYETEEPPRRSRLVLVAGALAGAIAMGGGLAYAYKSLVGPPRTEVATPVVKGDAGPSKVKPADPGGKQFAHADSKIMGRLGEAGAGAAAAAGEADAAGSRKVQTLTVGRDGSIGPPGAASEPPAAGQGPVTVPGLTIVDGYGGRPTAMPATSPPEPPAAPPSMSSPPAAQKPVVIAKATPVPASPAPEPPARSAPAPAEPPPVKKPAVAKAAPAAAGGGGGYVAVIASVPASSKSRMEALKQFADLQQKYGSLLQNRTPDVQEANLGEKGSYHRLLVGPPGSREQAATLCTELKAAGYPSCWVTSY